MRFELLGRLAVWDDGGKPVAVVGPSRRGLLAVLLLHAGEVLTADRLIDELWGERAPPTAAKSLQVHVWRLRKALDDGGGGDGRLVTVGGGYVIHVEPGQLDLEVFERLLAQGRAALADGRAQAASTALAEALALWHGQALAEFVDQPFAREASSRLEELYAEAIEARVDADLLLGRHRALIAELESLIAANPLRERLRAQLMLALYRCGRQADALAVYRDTRKLLDEDLGLEPGPELSALEKAVLAHDPSLDPETVTHRRAAEQLERASVAGAPLSERGRRWTGPGLARNGRRVRRGAAGHRRRGSHPARGARRRGYRAVARGCRERSGGAEFGGGDRPDKQPCRCRDSGRKPPERDRVRVALAVGRQRRRSDRLADRPGVAANAAHAVARGSADGAGRERQRDLGGRIQPRGEHRFG